MSKKDPFIYSEYPLFNDIVDRGVFESFNTSEKIKLLLQKDIFKIGNTWYNRELYCGEDFSKLDFSVFEKLDFNLNETYKIDNKIISLNPLVTTEVFKGICGAIYLCPKTTAFLNEIKFQSTTLSKQKDKEKYLRKKIARIDPFKLPTLLVEFDWSKNKIGLAPEQSIEIVSNNPDFILEWITGEHYPGGMYQATKHPNLDSFYSSYQKFIIAEFCFNEIKSIEKQNDDKNSLANNQNNKGASVEGSQKNWSTYEFAYLFEKLGIVDKMKATGLTFEAVSEIIGTAINRSPKNFRTCVLEIVRTSYNDISDRRKNSQQKIDPIIQHFKSSE
tara:strand:- start:2027 stop:3019 length:993 start_codon:yes stop_codon:yes gene_type:complete